MQKSTLSRGRLEIFSLEMTNFNPRRSRTIRVWLPDGYDENNSSKKYPVFYMHDGQNLFDSSTSFAGEWEVDETLGKMMDEGYQGMIVVGIDNGGSERLNEYSPPWPLSESPKKPLGVNIVSVGDQYAEYIVNILKPYIDQKYHTLTDKTNTLIGGSSMGGIISFYTALTYQETFGSAVIFSSSFWIYEEYYYVTFLNQTIKNPLDFPKMYFYHSRREGGYSYMLDIGAVLSAHEVSKSKYCLVLSEKGEHNERAWAKAFPAALKWLVNFKNNFPY